MTFKSPTHFHINQIFLFPETLYLVLQQRYPKMALSKMTHPKIMNDILHIENFIEDADDLFVYLRDNTEWDERMAARKTASYGIAYNYAQITYPYQEMPDYLKTIANKLADVAHFLPNNCLINYYPDGSSRMGYHSDQTDILCDDTGIAIISLGTTRTLRFRNILESDQYIDYELHAGSLVLMSQTLQKLWQHALPKSPTHMGRMSLTFRQLKS